MTILKDNEQKKDYLNRYGRIKRKISSLTEQKESLLEEIQSVRSVRYDGMPHSHQHRDLSDYMVRVEDLLERIEKVKFEQHELKLEIEKSIMEMEDGIECDILRKKYIEFKSWEIIADEIGYSVKQAQRIHGKALEHYRMSFHVA